MDKKSGVRTIGMRGLPTVDRQAQQLGALFGRDRRSQARTRGRRGPLHVSFWPWKLLLWLVCPLVALIATSQWFTPGLLLGGGDNFPGFFPDPGNWLARVPYSWDLTGIGGPTSLVQEAPQIITIYLLRLALDPAGAQHAFYALLLAAQLLSMMLLMLTVLPGHRVAALLGALFYVFNPATVIDPPGFFVMFVAAFLPCIAALFIRAATGPLRLDRILAFTLAAGLSGFLYINPPTLAILLIFSLLLVAYVIAINRTARGRTVGRIALLAGLALLVNAYWLADGYFLLHSYVQQGLGGLAATVDGWGFVSARASILNLFWLNSTWAWDVYFPFSAGYRTPLLLAVVFVPTLLAFSSLLNRTIPRIVALPASVIALMALFLSTGQHQPWGTINLFLFHHVPLFWLFREPNTKFVYILLIVYAFLVGYQAEWFAIRAARVVRWRAISFFVQSGIAILFAGTFLLSGFPLVTGASVGRGYGANANKAGFVIPSYWYDLSRYLSRVGPTDGVLLLPNDDYYQMRYTWGYYGLDSVANELLHNRVIPVSGELGYIANSHNGSLTGQILKDVQTGSSSPIVPYLNALGTRYVLQRNDIDATEPGRHVLTPQQVRTFLAAQHGLRLVRSFGKLDLYEVDQRYYVPPVYAVAVPRRDLSTTNLKQTMTRILSARLGVPTVSGGKAILVRPQVLTPSVTHENAVRYAVHIDSAKGPVLLVLSTSYHPSWHACLVSGDVSPAPWTCWFGEPELTREHVATLNSLNGWVIDHPGRYTVILDYGFQHVADITILISLVTIGVLLAVCWVRWYPLMKRVLLTRRWDITNLPTPVDTVGTVTSDT